MLCESPGQHSMGACFYGTTKWSVKGKEIYFFHVVLHFVCEVRFGWPW